MFLKNIKKALNWNFPIKNNTAYFSILQTVKE